VKFQRTGKRISLGPEELNAEKYSLTERLRRSFRHYAVICGRQAPPLADYFHHFHPESYENKK